MQIHLNPGETQGDQESLQPDTRTQILVMAKESIQEHDRKI